MSEFYDEMTAMAVEMIAEFGKPAVLYVPSTSGPPHNPTITEFAHPCTLVETENSLTNRKDTLAQAGDRSGLISVDFDVSPTMADKFEIDGKRHSFVQIEPLNPGGTVLLFEFIARA